MRISPQGSSAGSTATRVQRYVVSELAQDIGLPSLSGRYRATIVAVLSAMVLE